MSERFPDEVLQRAIDAYEITFDLHRDDPLAAMRAVLEGHLAEQAIAAIRALPRYVSDVNDLSYQAGVNDGRDEAVAAILAASDGSLS